ncbi:MAG: GntR family transcriptional regulator [Planctomycetota bacterium]
MPTKPLKPIQSKPGAPLYVSVKDAMLEAIRTGHYKPGDRLPSTKSLSEQLAVSLVTTHRAMQELEVSGVVDRVQGRGTFIKDRQDPTGRRTRLALILQTQASLADFYHGQLLEGMHRASREENADLLILQYEQKLQADCQGYLLVNPLPEAIDQFKTDHPRDTSLLLVGAQHPATPSVDVDNTDLIHQAVKHVHRLGHQRIAYLGGASELSNSRDRQSGFLGVCRELGIPADQCQQLDAESWRLSDKEKMSLSQLLASPQRPTAMIAGGYYLSLDVYNAANTLGLSIPRELTVVGVDDPPSATHLYPPLTTFRQPLVELGYAAISRIVQMIHAGSADQANQKLKADLIIRESSGAPAPKGSDSSSG